MFDWIDRIFHKQEKVNKEQKTETETLYFSDAFNDIKYDVRTGAAVNLMKLHIRTATEDMLADDFVREHNIREISGLQLGYLYIEFPNRLTDIGEHAVEKLLISIKETHKFNIPDVLRYLKKSRVWFCFKFSPIKCLPVELNAALYFREFVPLYTNCKEYGIV